MLKWVSTCCTALMMAGAPTCHLFSNAQGLCGLVGAMGARVPRQSFPHRCAQLCDETRVRAACTGRTGPRYLMPLSWLLHCRKQA